MKRSMDGKGPGKPIVSTRTSVPELEERIDAFVLRMGERIDHLQDVETSGNLSLLRELSESFGSEARELGYAPLAEAASRVAAGCLEGNPEAARKSLADLTEVSQRVRRGHRSSA